MLLTMEQIKNKLNEIDTEQFNIEWDEDPKDNRLFPETVYPRTLTLSREEYNKYEKILEHSGIGKRKYEIYFWNDSSGYEYWTLDQEEDNYIQATILIKDKYLTEKDIKNIYKDLEIAIDRLDTRLSELGIGYYDSYPR